MKIRDLRRRYKVIYLRGPWYKERRVFGKYTTLRVFEGIGHDEHNCWTEYLIARYK